MSTAPRAADAGSNEPVDSETIRRSYEAVLSAPRPLAGDDSERLGGLLLGHVQLLVPELARVEPRMRGEQQRTAGHVLTRTRRMLTEGIGTSPQDVWDLAIQCRALLTLHVWAELKLVQPPGP